MLKLIKLNSNNFPVCYFFLGLKRKKSTRKSLGRGRKVLETGHGANVLPHSCDSVPGLHPGSFGKALLGRGRLRNPENQVTIGESAGDE